MLVILSKCHPTHYATDSIIYSLLNCLSFAYLRPCNSRHSVLSPLHHHILEAFQILIDYNFASPGSKNLSN